MYRVIRELELLHLLLTNFIFDLRTLIQISKDMLAKQKTNFNNSLLLKIANDFDSLGKVLEDSCQTNWALRKRMIKTLKKITSKLDMLAIDPKSKDKPRSFIETVNDPGRLYYPISRKDKIWMNCDKYLPKIEKYSNMLLVW